VTTSNTTECAAAKSSACLLLTLVLVTLLPACGGVTRDDEQDDPVRDAAVEERACLPNCTVGHQCCIGSCSGPPAETSTDCCACVAGEVDSRECGGTCASE
jgi:hypothetical protein